MTSRTALPFNNPSLPLAIMLLSALIACSNAAPTVQNIEPQTTDIQKEQTITEPDSENDQEETPVPQQPQKSAEEWVQIVLPALKQGTVEGAAHLPASSVNQALYLLRSGNYAAVMEAIDHLDTQTPNTRFLYAKAQIETATSHPGYPLSPKPSETLAQCQNENKDALLNHTFAYWMARAYIAENDIENGISATRNYIRAKIDTKRANELVLGLAPLAIDHPQYHAEILQWLDSVINTGNAFVAANAFKYKIDIIGKTKPEKAESLTRSLLQRYPSTQMTLWPELASLLPSLSHSERFARAEKLIHHFDYENARSELRELAKDPAYHDRAQWLIAKISMSQNRDNPRESELIYRDVASKQGPDREEATFSIVRALSRQLNYEEAIKAIRDYEKRYPRGKYKMRCLYLKGWYHFELRHNEEARPYLLDYARQTGDTAVWGFYAWTFIREKRWTEAISAFDNLIGNGNPIVRGKALYWQAYAYYQLNDTENCRKKFDDLHKQYPLTYYDILAFRREAEWFGIPFRESMHRLLRHDEDPLHKENFTMTPFGMANDLSGLSGNRAWKQVLTLAKYDEIEAARAIYQKSENAILASVKADRREAFKAYATFLVENYNAAWEKASGSVKAMSSTIPERNNPRHQMAYPKAFAPIIENLEARFGVPAIFMYGIMLQESRFRPWQVSTADAIGALQMIPKTARALAPELGTTYHPETFFDPKIGFPYSALYMKKHMTQWHNNLTMTAGSYNGGPHRIGPWMLREKGATMDFLVEEFSFDESRHYCRKVAEHSLRYIYLYVQSEEQQIKYIEMFFPETVNYDIPENDWGI